MMSSQTRAQQRQPEVDFHGAAIIDASGREIPITEEMIRDACDKLESSWTFPVIGNQRQAG